MGETNRRVKTTETTLDIIHALRDFNGARIDELAAHLNIAPSTVHRHLSTLQKRHYIRKEGDVYALSLRFLTLGGHVQAHHPGYNIVKEKVDQLADETGERSQFIVEENGFRIYLHMATGRNAVQTDGSIGKRGYLHPSAAGKAILATFSQDRIEQIIAETGLRKVTDNTISSKEDLFDELDDIRDRGYAYNIEESTIGLRALGTAVIGPKGKTIGALGLSGPAHRFTGDRFKSELPNTLLGAANEIELNMKF